MLKEFDYVEAISRARQERETSFSRILFTAERLFAARGYALVGIRDIAGEVGINVSTLHFHWRNKQTLYEGVCRYQASVMAEAFTAPFNSTSELMKSLEALIDVLSKHPHIASISLQSFCAGEDEAVDTIVTHDANLLKGLSQTFKATALKGSLARRHPELAALNLLYSMFLLFADSAAQKLLLQGSVYEGEILQKRIRKYVQRSLQLILEVQN